MLDRQDAHPKRAPAQVFARSTFTSSRPLPILADASSSIRAPSSNHVDDTFNVPFLGGRYDGQAPCLPRGKETGPHLRVPILRFYSRLFRVVLVLLLLTSNKLLFLFPIGSSKDHTIRPSSSKALGPLVSQGLEKLKVHSCFCDDMQCRTFPLGVLPGGIVDRQ